MVVMEMNKALTNSNNSNFAPLDQRHQRYNNAGDETMHLRDIGPAHLQSLNNEIRQQLASRNIDAKLGIDESKRRLSGG